MGMVSFFFLLHFLLLLLSSSSASGINELQDVNISSSCSSNFLDGHPHLHHGGQTSGNLLLTLHHTHGQCSPLNLPPSTADEIFRHDTHRVHFLTTRLLPNTTTKPLLHQNHLDPVRSSTVNLPLTPGLSLGTGNYVTKIGLGTPAKDYFMIVDTGSSLTWLQCQPCLGYCYPQSGPIFDPKASSSYSPVRCSAPECALVEEATLNPPGCYKTGVCIYEASYGDGSFSVGLLGKDVLSFGRSKVINGFVYGCGQENKGLFGKVAGLIGLAKDKLSLVGQASAIYGYTFSYCLPTTSASGYLSIGSIPPSKFTFTPLLSYPLVDDSFYFIKLIAITVAGKPIPAPVSIYSTTPTIIDSGTVITRLPTPIYKSLSKAVVAALSKSARAPAYSILDTCFKGSYKSIPFPSISLVFSGGAELKLSGRNSFYDFPSKGITCLAFATSSSFAIIGNRQQQTFSVVYDIGRSRIGFAPCGCA